MAVCMNEDAQVVAAETTLNRIMAMPQAEENELEGMVREHARLVYRVTYSLLRNHHDAEDATQETFLRLLRYRHKLRSVRDRKAWLVRVAWRVALDRKNKIREISVDDVEEYAVAVPVLNVQADDNIMARQLSAALGKLIAGLPAKLRDPLILSTVEDLSTPEIAAVLGMNESAVRSRIFRARQILKEKLATILESDHGTRR
jgi:RNA polymerase sigma-70 factor (ECF subfamily)